MSQHRSTPGRILYEGTSNKPLARTGEESSGPVLSFRGQPDSSPEPGSSARAHPAPEAPVIVGRLHLVKFAVDDYGHPLHDQGAGRIQKTFADPVLAEEYLRKAIREWHERWLANPWFDLARSTSLTPGLLRDLVMDLGLEPPALDAESDEAWLAWWQQTAPHTNDWQRQQFLSALLDKANCYRLVPVDLAE
jgi:hypothetical protein